MPAPYRKACVHCVRAKRRCDVAFPRCYRCRVRSLECHYENSPSVVREANVEGESVDETSSGTAGSVAPHPSVARAPETVHSPLPDFEDWQMDLSLPSFPDYNLDWQDVMQHIEEFSVPDQLRSTDSPSKSVLAGDIYQERIIYCVKRLKTFPTVFVRQGQTPFIHKMLYASHVPEAIQDVLALCALYDEKNEANQALVYHLISQRAEKLVGNSAQLGSSALEQLAAVQALILFQIIRLFDGDIRQRADAERAEPVFLDWLRQLQQRMHHLGDHGGELTHRSLDRAADSWRSWLFAESVRRTVVVGYTVYGLYFFLKHGWDDSHHEFERLSFFAQKAVWMASSEYQWKSALEKYQPFPVRFSTWDADVTGLNAADLDDIGMMMTALMKGVDYCSHWAGEEYLDQFGLT